MSYYSELLFNYYLEEKVFSTILIIIGLLSFLFSLFFLLIIKYQFFKGMAIILFFFAILYIFTGIKFTSINNNKINQFTESKKTNVLSFFVSEQKKTNSSVRILYYSRWFELICIILSFGLYMTLKSHKNSFWKGLFLALSCMFFISFIFNEYSIKSKESYLTLISGLIN
jgi:uncharacterized membrane protein